MNDFFTLFPVYSQIWLNLLRDDHYFFYMFLQMIIVTLGYKQKFLKQTLVKAQIGGVSGASHWLITRIALGGDI
jgi:hypothetical protein